MNVFAKIVMFALLATVWSVNAKPQLYEATNANAFIDQILASVMAKYNKTLDPFHVPDKVVSFRKKIGIITVHGEAKLEEGTITGLSHLKRSGDSTMNTEDKHFVVKLKFGDQNIRIHYKAEASFEDLHTSATLESQVGDIDVKATVALGSDGKPTLSSFEIDELRHVKIDVHTPLKILDHLVDALAEGFITVFNPMARDLISKVAKDLLEKELKNAKFP